MRGSRKQPRWQNDSVGAQTTAFVGTVDSFDYYWCRCGGPFDFSVLVVSGPQAKDCLQIIQRVSPEDFKARVYRCWPGTKEDLVSDLEVWYEELTKEMHRVHLDLQRFWKGKRYGKIA